MLSDEVEDWEQLCRDAVREEDPDKLMAIVERLNRVLERGEKHGKDPLKYRSE
jgi:hypothetical protein